MCGYKPPLNSLFVNIVYFTPYALEAVRDVLLVYEIEHYKELKL